MLKKYTKLPLYFFIALSLLFYAGCGNPSLQGNEVNPDADKALEEIAADPPEEENPDLPIGLYVKSGSGKRVLQNQMQAEYVVGKDIAVLSAFLTNDPEISGSKFATVWLSYQNEMREAAVCKIGYRLSYSLVSGEYVEQVIKGPLDTEQNRAYLETYIYDDVHQNGWYSHLLASDITEKTVITSIKLTGGPNVAEVNDMMVEVFLYKEEEPNFDYGSSSVEIIKK